MTIDLLSLGIGMIGILIGLMVGVIIGYKSALSNLSKTGHTLIRNKDGTHQLKRYKIEDVK